MRLVRGHSFGAGKKVTVRPKLLRGLRLAVDQSNIPEMIIFDEVIRDEGYDLDLVTFTPDQIFDCGGYVGMFSVLAHSRFPGVPITVFEPSPQNVTRIVEQARLNKMRDIEIIRAAVSSYSGTTTFKEDFGFAGRLSDHAASNDAGCYPVPVIDLAAVIRERKPQRMLLKLDVEGEERKIIPCLFDVLPRTSAIFFETHYGLDQWDSTAKQFRDNGFKVERRRSLDDQYIDGFAIRD
jgi:FkbM family methyltransferase